MVYEELFLDGVKTNKMIVWRDIKKKIVEHNSVIV